MVFFTLILVKPAATQAVSGNRGALSAHDRELIAEAQSKGQSAVALMIAAAPGRMSEIVTGIQKFNGKLRFRDDGINYVRAIIPIKDIESVIGLAGIDAVKLDELVPLDDPEPEGGGRTMAEPPPAPGPSTTPLNPYLPTQDIGAPQFVQTHPTFDGRGVKIGIVDTGIDLLTPELQSATTLDGTPTLKIVDWVNMNDPLDPAGSDPSWIEMKTQVYVAGGSFSVNSVQYAGVPEDGVYRFGIFDEGKISPDSTSQNSEYAVQAGGVWCADLNRNGACHERFAVLWRTSDDTVWVDSNADRSFADEAGMKDYKVKFDVGLFGVDDPATPVRESVPFVVQTDGKDKYVNIGIVGAAHATHVAGIAAGKGFFGGAFNGAAPEAQIVSVRACTFGNACTFHGMIEGMIYAAKQANVDVINMSIGGLAALNDGNSVFSILYNRLIDQTKAQMFLSAGNAGPGINTVGDPSISKQVMSVGASVTKETWYANYGLEAAWEEGLFGFSSRGPTEEGGFKPNIVAPGCAISSIPGWQPGQAAEGTYSLPPGYALFNGTSMAAPEATGGAALLISAAKQTGAQYKPEQLRQAINSSAGFLPDYGAHEQGNGVFQVGAAWNLLQTNINTVEITSAAPVETVLSDFLVVPHTGTGIYQREGWAPGDSRTLNITFTRKEGTSKPISYEVVWMGNDGTFSSAGSIALPRDVPVMLPVTVQPQTPGVHSANLNLISDSGQGFDYQVMNTVVVAEPLTLDHGYTATVGGSVDRGEKEAFFFYVPESAPYMKFDLTPISGAVRLWVIDPQGIPYGYTSFATSPLSATIQNPPTGVWEVTIEASPLSPATPADFSATVTLLGASIDPPSWTIEHAQIGMLYVEPFTYTNDYAAFTGGATGTSLASTYKTRSTIAAGQPQYYDIMVPAGSTYITVQTSNPSDPLANLDLYLYDCTAGAENCVLAMSSANYGSAEFLFAFSPNPGLWRVLVNPASIPSGSMEYDYVDAINGSYGFFITGDSTTLLRPAGAIWSSTAIMMVFKAPEPGRFLQGRVYVISQAAPFSIPIGTAEVTLYFDN
jgi:hypothetical protein